MELVFDCGDFDAYLPPKWASNIYNLERLKVRQKCEALGKTIAADLHIEDTGALDWKVSAEHPALWNQRRVKCQYLFFVRPEKERQELEATITRGRSVASLVEDPSPYRSHGFIGVRINHQGIIVCFRVHTQAAVDRKNLKNKAGDLFHRGTFIERLHELGESAVCGTSRSPLVPVAAFDGEALTTSIEEIEGHDDSWFSVQFSFERAYCLDRGPAIVADLRQSCIALIPIFQFVCWSKGNDHIGLNDALKTRAKQHQAKGIQASDRIRVVRGMFSGKLGHIVAVENKDTIKVQLGKMTVRLKVDDISPL